MRAAAMQPHPSATVDLIVGKETMLPDTLGMQAPR
jgi:hypothetical protein